MQDDRLSKILSGKFDESMPFRQRAWAVCCRIPAGKVATYATIAEVIFPGRGRQHARAVGQAMRTNPHAPQVPCHRVIASDRTLTGYSGPGGLAQKRQMLDDEGICFESSPAHETQLLRIQNTSLINASELIR